MRLIALYEGFLDSLDVQQAETGELSAVIGGSKIPLEVEEKRLVMPTKEVLRKGLGDSLIAFHPAAEKIMRGESEVFKKLRSLVVHRLSGSIGQLAVKLLEVAVDTGSQKKLPSGALKLLKQLSDVDEKTLKAFTKVVEAAATDPDGRFVQIFNRRSAKLGDDNFMRVSVVQFPYLDCFTNPKEVLGVKLRAKDFEMLQAVFEVILPGSKEPNAYSAGSNSLSAPYLTSLLLAYKKIAERINEVDRLFTKVEMEGEHIAIPMAWAELLPELDDIASEIPVLSGNEGAIVSGGEDDDEVRVRGDVIVPDKKMNERNRRDDDRPPFEPDPPKKKEEPVQTGAVVNGGVDFSRPTPGHVREERAKGHDRYDRDDRRDERDAPRSLNDRYSRGSSRDRDRDRDGWGNDRRERDRDDRYTSTRSGSSRGDRSWGNEGSRWDEGRGRGREDRYERDDRRDDRGRGREDSWARGRRGMGTFSNAGRGDA